jgi:formylglycine-generating enzyme required for sulfatase activity
VLVFAARQAGAARGVPAADTLINSQSLREWQTSHALADGDWRSALLAGEQLLEIGLAVVDSQPAHQAVKNRVAGWLAGLVLAGALPVKERARAGVALGRLGDPRPGVGLKDGLPDIDWLDILAGPFLFGDPQETCALITEPYRISRYPVTVAQYQVFVEAGGYGESRYWTKAGWEWKTQAGLTALADSSSVFKTPNHPRVGASWYEALAFCRWYSEQTKQSVSLPNEYQWERAARHTDGRVYPWGNEEIDPARHGNVHVTGLGSTSAVGLFPEGQATCGAMDMAGNAWEWCSSPDDGSEADRVLPDLEAVVARVLRGGSWSLPHDFARCSFRGRYDPDFRNWNFGFRVVASPFFSVL